MIVTHRAVLKVLVHSVHQVLFHVMHYANPQLTLHLDIKTPSCIYLDDIQTEKVVNPSFMTSGGMLLSLLTHSAASGTLCRITDEVLNRRKFK